MSTARSWGSLEKPFLPGAALQLWREAQHLPLTMRLTRSQTPSSNPRLLGVLPPPRPPSAPCTPATAPAAPPAPTARAKTKPMVAESTRLLATGCLAWALFSSDPSRLEGLIACYGAASGGDGAASCAGLCSPPKGVTRSKCGSCTGQGGCVAPSWPLMRSPWQ